MGKKSGMSGCDSRNLATGGGANPRYAGPSATTRHLYTRRPVKRTIGSERGVHWAFALVALRLERTVGGSAGHDNGGLIRRNGNSPDLKACAVKQHDLATGNQFYRKAPRPSRDHLRANGQAPVDHAITVTGAAMPIST